MRDRLDYGLHLLSEPIADRALVDESASSEIGGPADITDTFVRQYHFGCEADDPMNSVAFDRRLNPGGVQLKAVFGSDLGHWDVPDLRGVLPEAWELVDDGHITVDDFRAFAFTNAVSPSTAPTSSATPSSRPPYDQRPMTPDAPALWTLANREPTDVAMSDVRRTLTWADLERETNQFGRGLEARGLVPGDHVAVVARNHVEFLVAIIGSRAPGWSPHP